MRTAAVGAFYGTNVSNAFRPIPSALPPPRRECLVDETYLPRNSKSGRQPIQNM